MKNKSYLTEPLVSVIVNCHNGEKFLKECLDSVVNQTYKKWELIFWDNFSKDSSKEIFMQYNEKRFKYFHADKFTSLYTARNLALRKASGDFISFLDTDDFWFEKKLEKQLKVFNHNRNLGIVYSNYYYYFNKSKIKKVINKKMPTGKITQQLLKHYNIGGILTALCRRDLFKKKIFENNYEIIGDFDFFLNVSNFTYFGCVQEPLATYRLHGENTSLKKLDLQIKELEYWLDQNKDIYLKNNYSLNGVFINLQSLKIKKCFLDGNKYRGLIEIFKFPLTIKKLKFLLIFFVPKRKTQTFFNW